MPNRREFFRTVAGATAGLAVAGCRTGGGGNAARRQIMVGGRRVKTVDIHAHCQIDVWNLVKDYDWGKVVRSRLDEAGCKEAPCWGERGPWTVGPERVRLMDELGVDVQAISLRPYWYQADEAVARTLIQAQNERLADACAKYPDRFVALASVSMQYPEMAAQQLDEAVKKLGMHGVAIDATVDLNREELAAPTFDPFWAKAQELNALVYMHPQGVPGRLAERLNGFGNLTNVIGHPLETTIALSHLIFEGTLDRFPRLKVCAAHGGGYLAAYIGRSDATCDWTPGCKPIKKHPSEYFKDQILCDSLVFDTEGLRHLVAQHGASQIVFGTDFSAGWPTRGVDHILETPGLTDADKEAILGGNLVKLLRIKA